MICFRYYRGDQKKESLISSKWYGGYVIIHSILICFEVLHKYIKIIIMVIFIPLFLISSVTIGHNTVAIKNIIRENRFKHM